jgi:cytochrome c oxidase subunit II
MSPGRNKVLVIATSSWLIGSCAAAPSSLSSQSPAAAQITGLWWVMFGLGTVIWVGVVALLLGGLFRPRETDDRAVLREQDSHGTVNRWVVGGGIVMPTIVLVGLVAFTVGTLRAITSTEPSDEVVIEVVGHQWWWEVRYPHQVVVTANEIHIPVRQPIEVKLSSVDVIHSFWVPELHGKFDLIPGQTNTFILQADQPGEYRGQCAEFCGRQHAKMGLIVIAESLEDFTDWVALQAQPATEPADELSLEGKQVFLGSRCVECHSIRGTNAVGTDGPDLTHLASRSMLAAATLTNTPEHLAEWVSDPQSLKPGTLMPIIDLDSQKFLALLTYLESLK